MVADPATTLLVARAGEEIVGITTLVVFRVATGMRAFIDDVVVSDAHRGKGLGENLVRAAIAQAASLGVQKIDLTSRPSREAANRLYRRLGFEPRQTNIYRLLLAPKATLP
jgi:ribosomal protein S18 acetylase RimI-like enzyme